MKRYVLTLLMLIAMLLTVTAQEYNQIDEMGNVTQRDESNNRNFNPHNNDSTHKDK